MTPRALALALALGTGACATGPVPPAASPTASPLPDLGPTALGPDDPDPGCPPDRCAPAGAPVALRLDPTRDAVRALVEGYLQALSARDLDAALRPFDDTVGGVAQAQPLPTGAYGPLQLRARHEQLVTELSRLGSPPVRVWSSQECVARGGCSPAHRPGDWYCDWETPAATTRIPMPRSALVRVVDGRPRIVGLTDSFLTGRR